MNRRAGSVVRLATPFKAWTQRFALWFLVTAAVALMVMGRADIEIVQKARTVVADGVAPILEFASAPVSAVDHTVEGIHNWMALAAENTVLRENNRRLEHWQTVARRLEAENIALRALLDVSPDPTVKMRTARVIGDQGGAFVRSVLVNAGHRDGVVRGQAALAGEGLAGRVAESGDRSSRVLLITDMNSRIPVLVGQDREQSVMAGDNTAQPRLLYLGQKHSVAPGDRVVTSGQGGVFPPDLPIGIVSGVDESGIRIQPFLDRENMEFLRLVEYELPGLLRDFRAETTTSPRR